jgi:hypothetical protein
VRDAAVTHIRLGRLDQPFANILASSRQPSCHRRPDREIKWPHSESEPDCAPAWSKIGAASGPVGRVRTASLIFGKFPAACRPDETTAQVGDPLCGHLFSESWPSHRSNRHLEERISELCARATSSCNRLSQFRGTTEVHSSAFWLALVYAKFRWLNYLRLRSITQPFFLLSTIYTLVRGNSKSADLSSFWPSPPRLF